MKALDEIRNTVIGAEVLADWLGDGGNPVDQATADGRAARCLRGNDGKMCEFLGAQKWWEGAKGAVAFAIKEHLEAKSELNLSTEMDQHNFMCRACGCCLATKVWTPIKYVAEHTPEEVLKKMPGFCWQRIEIENL